MEHFLLRSRGFSVILFLLDRSLADSVSAAFSLIRVEFYRCRALYDDRSRLSSGLFSFAGDNHEIQAPIASGALNESARTVELRVEVGRMRVLDPNLSADKRSQVQEKMLSPDVLYPDRHRGSATIKQTDFGIKPISIGGGTIKVKDEIKIDFDIVTLQP